MTEYVVELDTALIAGLAESFRQGPILEIRDGAGIRLLTEETIARINGVKVEIFANEHPPPHFRVKYQSSTANFQISDCTLMNGSGEVLKYERNIIFWWRSDKRILIDSWNRLRPSGCPVGAYIEPTSRST